MLDAQSSTPLGLGDNMQQRNSPWTVPRRAVRAVVVAGTLWITALAAALPAASQNPDDALAKCQDQSVGPEARISACTTVIEKGEDDRKAEAYLNRGLLREQSGDLAGALADYTKSIELDGENENAWFNRGNVHEAMGQYPLAIRDYDKAIEINATDADFFNNRGRVWDSQGETKKAVEDYTAAIKLNAKHPMAHFNRAVAHAELGQHDRAVPDFDQAVTLGLADADLWTARALSLEALGRNSDAIESLAKAVAANPDHEGAKEALARLKK